MIAPADEPERRQQFRRELPYTGDGVIVNSQPDFDGMPRGRRSGVDRPVGSTARARAIASVNYRLRDWLHLPPALLGLARSRSCTARRCGAVPVPEEDSPVRAPRTSTTTSPRAIPARGGRRGLGQHLAAPSAEGPARRETDTMDTFVDSSWDFLRYCDARNYEAALDPAATREWIGVCDDGHGSSPEPRKGNTVGKGTV